MPGGYARRLVIEAPNERVFDAIATIDGPRHWWTTKVTGSAAVGGELQFGLTARGPGECELEFHHTGLPAELVAEGWEHFLASLVAYAETGTGMPFGE